MKLYELFKTCDYSDDPFPHWTSDAFFPDSIAESLVRNFPNSKDIYKQFYSDTKYTQNTAYTLQFDSINGSRRVDQDILKELIDAWQDDYKEIITEISDIIEKTTSIDIKSAIQSMYCRGDFRACSPVTLKNTTQLGPHCDNPRELFAGIVYLNDKNKEEIDGGDLIIYKLKKNAPKRYMSHKRRIPEKYLNEYKKIRYGYNKAIFFVPTELAIHGVSIRMPGREDRRMINLSVEAAKDSTNILWEEKKYMSKYLYLKSTIGKRIDKHVPKTIKERFFEKFLAEANALGIYKSIEKEWL